MLKYFGSSSCPRCATALIQETKEAAGLPSDQTEQDERWLCPSCGYSRPMVYAVVRPVTEQGKG